MFTFRHRNLILNDTYWVEIFKKLSTYPSVPPSIYLYWDSSAWFYLQGIN